MDSMPDPGAIEDQSGRNDRQPRPEGADADGDEDRRQASIVQIG